MNDSRIPGMYRLSVSERIDDLERRGWLIDADARALRDGRHVLSPRAADRMVENVIASFGLPFAIAPNFVVDGKEFIVPLVVEEPSIVAALSSAARCARDSGGFETECKESLMIGQVHLTGIEDVEAACASILDAKELLLASANAVHPRLVRRGGGVRDIEVRTLSLDGGADALAVHLLVDTCDAMGANLVNTICESVAPELAELAQGTAAMRILSNLGDRALVTARVQLNLDDNERDAIVLANEIARADPYRAATHNKGIMNGVDALAIATGNDWRALEAGAHAFAAASGAYRPLTHWSVTDDGRLLGEICMPLKVGIVGGTAALNAAAGIGLRICGVDSAIELARLMAAVGLAQNFAAIRALSTSGIQSGHMRLHARSVAAAAGVPQELFDDVVAELIAAGEIKDWKAREILLEHVGVDAATTSTAAGKVILMGEHAAVYGKHALALPITGAVSATATRGSGRSAVTIPAWSLHHEIGGRGNDDLGSAILLIARELGVELDGVAIQVDTRIPRAMGLGSSAAIAVAITRALAAEFDVTVDDDRVNAIAFECEKLAHGTPSGVDNTVATFGQPLLFQRGDSLRVEIVDIDEVPPIVIACSNSPGLTREQVARVRERRLQSKTHYDAIFEQLDAASLEGARALAGRDYATLGALMNICHGLLNALQVSTPELERMVSIARDNGAVGAKLTGGGGGGSIVALCPGSKDAVQSALADAGYRTIVFSG